MVNPTPTPTRPAAVPTPTPTRPAAVNPPPVVPPAPTPTPPPAVAPNPTPTPPPAPATPTPTVAPSPTPSPEFPTVALPDADARPYRYNLTYTRNDNLGAVPPSENGYTVTWRSYSAEDVAALKDALELRGPVEQTDEGFRVTDPGTLIVSNAANGLIRYVAPGVTPTSAPGAGGTEGSTPTIRGGTASRGAAGATRTPAPALTDAAALAAAKTWLDEKGLPLPADAGEGRVTRPVAGQVAVTFNPRQPAGPFLGDPAIVVVFDAASGAVREASYRWPSGIADPTLIRLRPVAAAWADVQAGKGHAEVESPVPANTPPGTAFRGAARATTARIGWTLATNDDGTSYLLPIYVFEGAATLEGQSRPAPFRVFIPATP